MSTSRTSGGEGNKARADGPRAARKRKILVLVLLFVIVALAYAYYARSGRGAPNPTLSFGGDSRNLARTQIVPTLDTPIEPGKNVIWCASFLAGWKQLQQNVVNGPVQVAGADEVCARLNAAADPSTYLPPELYYATAGTEDNGILQTIEKDMAERFPGHQIPSFEDIIPGSFVTYSYLEARIPFPVPYFDSREPMVFAEVGGANVPVKSFGLRKEDRDRYGALRQQARLLMAEWPEAGPSGISNQPPSAFAVDLCGDSYPCQIIVARVERLETLAATLDDLNTRIESYAVERGDALSLGGNDILLVPDMFWQITHHLLELEKHVIESPPIQGQEISVSLQEIQFRLDRSGAELSSEAHQRWASDAGLGHYVCDRPFLVYMKYRGLDTPFFVMWVDNAELLQQWDT